MAGRSGRGDFAARVIQDVAAAALLAVGHDVSPSGPPGPGAWSRSRSASRRPRTARALVGRWLGVAWRLGVVLAVVGLAAGVAVTIPGAAQAAVPSKWGFAYV